MPLVNQAFDHFFAELDELFEAADVIVRQLIVVQSEQTQQGDVKVTDEVHVLNGLCANAIGCPNRG